MSGPLEAGACGASRAVPVVLSIAGSDPSGGAGIQADLACWLALGVRGTSAITALTAQNSAGISAIQPVPAAFVAEQIRQVGAEFAVVAAKTGMLASADTVLAVAEAVVATGLKGLVVDPVFASTSGTRLLPKEAEPVVLSALFPLALVVTPNLAEAAALVGRPVNDLTAMREAARRLHGYGPAWVLIKGGHLTGAPVDLLFDGVSFRELAGERIEGRGTHGTGCVLSAAIVAHLALGASVPAAVAAAKTHVAGAIRHGVAGPRGPGCIDPAWNLR